VDIPNVTANSSVEDVYDASHIIDKLKSHLKDYDMLTCFKNTVNAKLDPKTNETEENVTTNVDIFEEYSRLTFQQVAVSVQWYMEWINDESHEDGKYVGQDMDFSAKFFYNQMDAELSIAIKGDIKDEGIPESVRESGPIVFKALVSRMMSTNEIALKLMKRNFDADRMKLSEFDGNVEEFAKKYTTLIKALRKCETRDASGNLMGQQHIPGDLSEKILEALKGTGNESFDDIFKFQLSQGMGAAALGKSNTFAKPEEILVQARKLYVQFNLTHNWVEEGGGENNPGGFKAMAGSTSKCFGCGRVGCRQSDRNCPRNGKDPNSEGENAKEEFLAAKKKKGKGTKNKWPKKPSKGEPNKQKIDGVWHYYHFNSSKWIECEDQDRDESSLKAEKPADDTPGGLPAALAAMTTGKDPQQVKIQTELYYERMKELEAQFSNNLA
jgi:hypothetical protein